MSLFGARVAPLLGIVGLLVLFAGSVAASALLTDVVHEDDPRLVLPPVEGEPIPVGDPSLGAIEPFPVDETPAPDGTPAADESAPPSSTADSAGMLPGGAEIRPHRPTEPTGEEMVVPLGESPGVAPMAEGEDGTEPVIHISPVGAAVQLDETFRFIDRCAEDDAGSDACPDEGIGATVLGLTGPAALEIGPPLFYFGTKPLFEADIRCEGEASWGRSNAGPGEIRTVFRTNNPAELQIQFGIWAGDRIRVDDGELYHASTLKPSREYVKWEARQAHGQVDVNFFDTSVQYCVTLSPTYVGSVGVVVVGRDAFGSEARREFSLEIRQGRPPVEILTYPGLDSMRVIVPMKDPGHGHQVSYHVIERPDPSAVYEGDPKSCQDHEPDHVEYWELEPVSRDSRGWTVYKTPDGAQHPARADRISKQEQELREAGAQRRHYRWWWDTSYNFEYEFWLHLEEGRRYHLCLWWLSAGGSVEEREVHVFRSPDRFRIKLSLFGIGTSGSLSPGDLPFSMRTRMGHNECVLEWPTREYVGEQGYPNPVAYYDSYYERVLQIEPPLEVCDSGGFAILDPLRLQVVRGGETAEVVIPASTQLCPPGSGGLTGVTTFPGASLDSEGRRPFPQRLCRPGVTQGLIPIPDIDSAWAWIQLEYYREDPGRIPTNEWVFERVTSFAAPDEAYLLPGSPEVLQLSVAPVHNTTDSIRVQVAADRPVRARVLPTGVPARRYPGSEPLYRCRRVRPVTETESEMSVNHSILLTDLEPLTPYRVQIVVTDSEGNTGCLTRLVTTNAYKVQYNISVELLDAGPTGRVAFSPIGFFPSDLTIVVGGLEVPFITEDCMERGTISNRYITGFWGNEVDVHLLRPAIECEGDRPVAVQTRIETAVSIPWSDLLESNDIEGIVIESDPSDDLRFRITITVPPGGMGRGVPDIGIASCEPPTQCPGADPFIEVAEP